MSRYGSGSQSTDRYSFLEGMRRMGQGTLGQEIVDAVESAVWTARPAPDPQRTRSWTGVSGRFRFVVIDFALGSRGSIDERGADGTVSFGSSVLRLGHQLGARARLNWLLRRGRAPSSSAAVGTRSQI